MQQHLKAKVGVMSMVMILNLFACSAAFTEEGDSPSTEAPHGVSAEHPFRLAVGESVTLDASRLLVGFEKVSGDSRCPSDVDCIWAGDATVEIWLTVEGGERTEVKLHSTTQPQEIVHQGYTVRLVELEPYPVSTKPIAPEDYLATLVVSQ